MNISTQRQLRIEFWINHPQFKRKGRTKHDDYPIYVRLAFCDFVEHQRSNGDLTEALAQRATL